MANNLLDKASVVLTPTAYNNGEALCVKPSDGSGDFDFSRNSAATRVNAQGLVENVQILSGNLVQNGDFSEEGAEEVSNGSFSQEGSELIVNGNFATDSDWDLRNAWVISNGVCSLTAPNSNYLSPSVIVFTANKFYKLTFDIVVNSGNLQPQFFDSGFQTIGTYSTSQSVEVYFQSTTNGTLYFKPNSFDGSIDNVSVREVGQDWVLSGGVSIGSDKAIFNATSQTLLYQNISGTTQGTTYKVTYTISEYISGSIFFGFGNGITSPQGTIRNADGTYTEYITKSDTNISGGFRTNAFIGSITNISVKEVGMDWAIENPWTIEDGVANGNGANGSTEELSQPNSFTLGKTYKVVYQVLNYVSGSIRFQFAGGGATLNGTTRTADGTFTEYIVATANHTKLNFRATNFNGSVTNISVIEITDDTNLPRINYEGFSYQDALGSELIVNGGFDNGFTNWATYGNTSVSNGVATIGASANSGIYQAILSQNKSYKVTINVTAYNGVGQAQIANDTGFVLHTINGVGEQSFIFEHTIPQLNLIIRGLSNALFSIDNVSVKEYLGQEVVPNSGCGSWLFEPQSTNLYTQSELFTDGSWSKTQTVIEASSITLPNGLTNGYKLFANTTGGVSHWLEKSPFPTATTGQDYTLSLFVKSAGSNFIQIASSTGFSSKYQNFNISTGTKASGDISDSSITDFGNGWYRISVTETTTATTARYLIVPILSDVGRNAQFAGNANEDGVYIWGAMLEQNSFSTSYIPTSGSQVTRNQDLCTNGGSLATINSTEGVFYAEIKRDTPANTFHLISLNNASSNSDRNSVTIGVNSGDNFYVRVKSPSGTFTSQTIPMSIGDFHKIAIRYEQANIGLFIDGTKETTYLGNYLFDEPLDNLSFDYNGNGSLKFFGKTKALAVWKEALTDAELTELTTI